MYTRHRSRHWQYSIRQSRQKSLPLGCSWSLSSGKIEREKLIHGENDKIINWRTITLKCNGRDSLNKFESERNSKIIRSHQPGKWPFWAPWTLLEKARALCLPFTTVLRHTALRGRKHRTFKVHSQTSGRSNQSKAIVVQSVSKIRTIFTQIWNFHHIFSHTTKYTFVFFLTTTAIYSKLENIPYLSFSHCK